MRDFHADCVKITHLGEDGLANLLQKLGKLPLALPLLETFLAKEIDTIARVFIRLLKPLTQVKPKTYEPPIA